ncbi:two-component system, OmpR family, sensor histidine kinase CpxA [Methylophilaceae bacterium]|nr:two-component system, OmpR family, sensor histidine kinase CpxA [Methylophilaceae bacterium]
MGRLFWKTFIGFSLTLIITGAFIGGAIYLNDNRLSGEEGFSHDRRAEFVVGITAHTLQYGGVDGAKALFKNWPGHKPSPTVMVIGTDGKDILHRTVSQNSFGKALDALASEAKPSSVRQVKTTEGREYILFVPSANADIASQLKFSLPLQLFIALFASLLFSAGFAIYLSHPIQLLRQASRHLAEGNLDTRVSPQLGKRNDEMIELAQDFDYMAARLQTLVDAQRLLLHDVSHELRSPVARMRLAIGLAQQQPEKLSSALTRIERETERLDELLGQMLTLSRLEAGISGEANEELNLNDLLAEIVQDVNFEAQAVGSTISLKSDSEILINGHYELLRRAFENIIRNALKYNKAGETVEVSIQQQDSHQILVEVRDHGPGLPENELDKVFQPFYRLGSTENTKNTGYGLGLAIARRAIEKHHGSISLSNCNNGGLCAHILFPHNLRP